MTKTPFDKFMERVDEKFGIERFILATFITIVPALPIVLVCLLLKAL